MSGNATTTAAPQESYGSSATKNRVRPGGDLGSSQYYYKTTATGPQAGEVEVYRYVPSTPGSKGIPATTKIGKIRPGGTFEAASKANGDPVANTSEILHYANRDNVNKARLQAAKVATKEWDGKTQPPPNQAIWGPYKPPVDEPVTFPGQTTKDDPLKGTSETTNPTGLTGEDQKKKTIAGALTQAAKPNTSLGGGKFLVYPKALREIDQDFIKLEMLQYKPKKMGTGQGSLGGIALNRGPAKNRKTLGSVYLPIPGGIMDTSMVDWGKETMNPLMAGAASLAYTALTKSGEETGAAVNDAFNALDAGSKSVETAIGALVVGAATKQNNQVLKRAEGAIINPNMELLFNSPQLRQFNFSWRLAPRDPTEGQDVIKIIRFFKQGMVPIRQEPNLFLRSPNTFKLTYHHKKENSEHKFLNKFKECALVNCQIQYTPDGNYATFTDGIMTSYQMTLAFNELDPIYSDDYDTLPTDQIGF